MDSHQKYNDKELVTLLVAGNALAFEAIYRRYAKRLFAYVRKNIPYKEECEEIVQDVFVSLWARRDKLEHVIALDAYIFRMVKYKVIRYFQHEKVKQRYAEHFKLFVILCEQDSTQSPELKPMIERGLSGLPERCQEAVRLRIDENLSNDEIAARMQIKKTTVENYFVTAMKHLRGVMQRA